MRGKVAVIGVGMIRFGELFDKSLENMSQEAYLNCLNNVDKGIDPKEIKAAWFGQWSGGFIGQGAQSGQSLASFIGNLEIPVTRIENACPTGGDTFRHACLGVASGVYDARELADLPQLVHEAGVLLGKGPQIEGRIGQRALEIVHVEIEYLFGMIKTPGVNQRLGSRQNVSFE